jgi:hypothetical protein
MDLTTGCPGAAGLSKQANGMHAMKVIGTKIAIMT